jgi:hypothetical protein
MKFKVRSQLFLIIFLALAVNAVAAVEPSRSEVVEPLRNETFNENGKGDTIIARVPMGERKR